uniref:Uncharacterized protein n=1 Tax=Romanomermis culicivorax TaxID=13658 RepID=A0A915JGJ5_ROMCU
MTMTFYNGSLQSSVYFPKSKGQLWIEFSKMLELFSTAHVLLHAFSERDQDHFALENEKITINGRQMLFSVLTSDAMDNFQCTAGYNVILIRLPLCEMEKPTRLERGFETLVIRSSRAMNFLIIDLTPVTDYVSEMSLNHGSIKITPALKEGLLNLSIVTTNLPGIQYNLGTILLLDILSDDWYKKVTIKGKIDFTLRLESSGNIMLIPRVFMSPLRSIVTIDENTVEEHQELLFQGRSLINYDFFKIHESILVITNARVDMMKSLVLASSSQPLLTVIVKNFRSSKMRSLKMKFDNDIEIHLGNLNRSKMTTSSDFMIKIERMASRLSQRAFLLRKDTRFRET